MFGIMTNLDKKTNFEIDSFKEKISKLGENKDLSEENLTNYSQYITNYGISLLDEAVMTQALPAVGEDYIEELFDLFKVKEISGKSDPKSYGFSALYRKKFYDFSTFHEAYLFFSNKAHLKGSKEYIGITENCTGKFLYFKPAKDLDEWLKNCLNDYRHTTQEVIDILSSSTTCFPLAFGKGAFF